MIKNNKKSVIEATAVRRKRELTIVKATVGKYIAMQKTGSVYDGKVINKMEFVVTQNSLFEINSDKTVAIDLDTGAEYPVLQKDEHGYIKEEQCLEEGKEYILTYIEEEPSRQKTYNIGHKVANNCRI